MAPMYPNDRRWLWLVAGLLAAFGLAIAAYELLGPERDVRLKFAIADEAPCSGERYELALSRWAARHWPPAVLVPEAEAEVVFVGWAHLLEADEAGVFGVDDQGRYVVAHDDAACDVREPTLEHEVGHAAYDLLDDPHDENPYPNVMTTPRDWTNLYIPKASPRVWRAAGLDVPEELR